MVLSYFNKIFDIICFIVALIYLDFLICCLRVNSQIWRKSNRSVLRSTYTNLVAFSPLLLPFHLFFSRSLFIAIHSIFVISVLYLDHFIRQLLNNSATNSATSLFSFFSSNKTICLISKIAFNAFIWWIEDW